MTVPIRPRRSRSSHGFTLIEVLHRIVPKISPEDWLIHWQENRLVDDGKRPLPIDVPLRAGQRILLSAKEFALLTLLAQRTGEVLSRTQIASLVWDIHFDSVSNKIKVFSNDHKLDTGSLAKYSLHPSIYGFSRSQGRK